ncbi:MAG: hypothetical protein RLZZ381_4156, partial [Cyanobacteriota bacterium]
MQELINQSQNIELDMNLSKSLTEEIQTHQVNLN